MSARHEAAGTADAVRTGATAQPAPTENMRAPLAPLGGVPPARPAWFDAALAQAPQRTTVHVHGADIETLAWGDIGQPGLLLLHGNRAHADWWSFIAPFFAADRRVVAMSWSGMGGSGWRERYSMDLLVDEMDAVAEATGLFAATRPPVAVAHSFGAFVALRYAADRGRRLSGVVTVDMPLQRRERSDRPRESGETSLRDNAVYPDLASALARYRFAPLQPCENLFIADHLARLSLKPAPDPQGDGLGVTWRFDPYLWRHLRIGSPAQDMLASQCPVAVMWGADSVLIDRDMIARIRTKYPSGMPWIEVPAAGHHVMVDQPLAFVAALRGLLAGWPRSGPSPGPAAGAPATPVNPA